MDYGGKNFTLSEKQVNHPGIAVRKWKVQSIPFHEIQIKEYDATLIHRQSRCVLSLSVAQT